METLQPLHGMRACVHIDQTDGKEFFQCEDCTHRTCEKVKENVRLLVGREAPAWYLERIKNT